MLNSPVSGSRTWICTIAAPARAASMAAAAICSGVIGQCGLLVTLVSSPVMAQVMMTSEFMAAGPRAHGARLAVILSLQQYNVPARHGKPRFDSHTVNNYALGLTDGTYTPQQNTYTFRPRSVGLNLIWHRR